MPIRTVGVLGCGLMGSGIVEVCARAGYETRVREVTEELTARGRRHIEKSLGRAVEKGKLEGADRDAALARLHTTTSLEDLADCDLIVEAVVEDLAAKNEMFAALDGLCPPETIFASNTSSLPIAAMAASTKRPDRFLGLHFFNPVPVMKLVEMIRGIAAFPVLAGVRGRPGVDLPALAEPVVATCSCGSGIPVQTVEVAGHKVTLVGLPLILAQFHDARKIPSDSTTRELLEIVKIYNPVPPGEEEAYAARLADEYAAFCRQKEPQA